MTMTPSQLRALYAHKPPPKTVTAALYGTNITTLDHLIDAIAEVVHRAPNIELDPSNHNDLYKTVLGLLNTQTRIAYDLYSYSNRRAWLARGLQDYAPAADSIDSADYHNWVPLLRNILRASIPGTRDHLSRHLIDELTGTGGARNDALDDAFYTRASLPTYYLYPRIEPEIAIDPGTGQKTFMPRFKVSYYADPDKCQRDIRTVTTLPRFCCRVLGLTEQQANTIRDLAVRRLFPQDAATTRMEIATTIDTIEWVYRNGPNSCMNSRGFFQNSPGPMVTLDTGETAASPVACYASPDLGVAFIRAADDPDRIVARAVVNRRDKLWARTYGDVELMITTLQAAGYNHSSSALAGCHIRHIVAHEDHDVWAQPYLDWADADCGRKDPYGNVASCNWGCVNASETPKSLDGMRVREVYGPRGVRGVAANYETGYAYDHAPSTNESDDENTFYCESCETNWHDDNYGTSEVYVEHRTQAHLVARSLTLCADCLNDGYTILADGRYLDNDFAVEVDGNWYWRYDSDIAQCDFCGDFNLPDELVDVIVTPDATNDGNSRIEQWCRDCQRRHAAECTDSNGTMTYVSDDYATHDAITDTFYTPAAYAKLIAEREDAAIDTEDTSNEPQESQCESAATTTNSTATAAAATAVDTFARAVDA